jgi:dTDP-4-dehydrorhamnose 3,5-epimerase
VIFNETPLAGAYVIDLEPRGDDRGFFARMFCAREFAEKGLATNFVQFNNSLSVHKGTLRGVHFQPGEHAETKLVRCVRGSFCDVIVDLRRSSRTFGQNFIVELSADNRRMLYVPKGFGHSFVTLQDDTESMYFVDAFYAPNVERGVRWDDPTLAIDWPLQPAVISDRDQSYPDLDPNDPTLPN